MSSYELLSEGVVDEVANPHLYQENPFRLLQVPVDERPRRIRRKLEDLEGCRHMGDPLYDGPQCLAPDTEPSSEQLQSASEKLEDGIRRLLYEFFWFWPGESEAGLIADISRSNLRKIQRQWESDRSAGDGIALHNLAVLYHLYALDLEGKASEGVITQKEQRMRLGTWRLAFAAWKDVTENRQVWDVLIRRVESMNDKRVRESIVTELQQQLPVILLTINASLAAQVAIQGKVSALRRHLEIMNSWGNDPSAVSAQQQAISEVLKVPRSLVTRACERLQQDTISNASISIERVDEFFEETAEMINLVRLMLPPDDPLRDAVLDECGRAASEAAVKFAVSSKDMATSLITIRQTLPFAGSATLRENLNETERTLVEAKRVTSCFFCSNRPPEEPAYLTVRMYGEVVQVGNQLRWKHGTIRIPRCPVCKRQHRWTTFGIVCGCLLGAAGGVTGYSFGTAYGWFGSSGWVAVLMTVVGSFIGAVLGRFIVRPKENIKGEMELLRHPAVKEQLAKGWKIGTGPAVQR